jgi:hypothetical protein
MNCWYCNENIKGEPWDHLNNIDDVSEDGKHIKTEKYVCSYKCCKRLHEEHRFPKNLWQHIVNKEDYKGLISPVIPKKDNEICLLTHDELKYMDVEDIEKYYNERDKQLYLDPEIIKLHDAMVNEDKRTEYLEFDSSSEDHLDDY